jgi:RNA 2',3'-cyclic 3'-phosphodiesterase
MLRLFVAVDLGPDVEARVAHAIAQARLAAPRAKWVHAGGVHLTLAFLGAVEGGRVPAVSAALARAAGGRTPIDLAVEGAGTFGKAAYPRVLWLGVAGNVRALATLARAVSAQLATLGFPPEERDFHPHLTLARARDPRGDRGLAEAARRLAAFDGGAARADRVLLMQSHLERGGARYEVVAEALLGAPSA